jgi:hypothetical protein
MARSIGMSISDPIPVYRAVILYLYPGIHSRPLHTYTTEDGQQFQYHTVEAYGPYGTKAPATSQVTSALRHHEECVKNDRYTTQHIWNQATRDYDVIQNGTIPQVTAFVESQIPAWSPIAGTERTA